MQDNTIEIKHNINNIRCRAEMRKSIKTIVDLKLTENKFLKRVHVVNGKIYKAVIHYKKVNANTPPM